MSNAATDTYDVIVIGGGHAGTEAALAPARMGLKTLLVTQNIDTLGQMSCNPAIGGIGKGHLVKEIDALGGLMARAADHAGIQFRTLNASKGPAVRATRAQADRARYRAFVRQALEHQANLDLFQQEVDDLWVEGGRVRGLVTRMGLRFAADAVVLTTGTFLGGRIHIGLEHHSGGRAGDAPSLPLAERLRALMPRVGRLKTGTPPRIDAKSVNFDGLQEQWGDSPEPVMSFMGSLEEHPEAETYPGVLVVRFDAGLFFASSDALEDRLRDLALAADPKLETIVLDFEGIEVVINEAVEQAKTFGAEEGHKFVNGVLDKLAGELRAIEVQANQQAKS